ncbi:DUF6221 family protein [Kitasatospora sp. NPDC056531]|uniref:DUF6221 family protein n=1 Tax=Kitasatospora sp. NPDC056531 TaxID=3345856 RepID=UPI0036A0289B
MTAKLVDWLRSELNRLEQIAQAAAVADGPVWTHNPDDGWIVEGNDGPVIYDEGSPTGDQAQHIARHDPAAVLRRVAADRHLLDEHPLKQRLAIGPRMKARPVWVCATCGGDVREDPNAYPCLTVRLLAEGYGWEEPQ